MKQLARKHRKSIYILTWKFNLKKSHKKLYNGTLIPLEYQKKWNSLLQLNMKQTQVTHEVA